MLFFSFQVSIYRVNREMTALILKMFQTVFTDKRSKRMVSVEGDENFVYILTDSRVQSQMTSCEIRARRSGISAGLSLSFF
jgi:hypothetical protein